MFCSLLYLQHLELCPALNYLLTEWMNKPGGSGLSYSATQSCILHPYHRNSEGPSPIPDSKLSPGQFQKLEMPFPIQTIKLLASPSYLFKSGAKSYQVDLTTLISVPSPPSPLLLPWFRLPSILPGIYWNNSLISSLIPFQHSPWNWNSEFSKTANQII